MALPSGTVVRLKSGGPEMTVERPAQTVGNVVCIWFERNSKKKGVFAETTLNQID